MRKIIGGITVVMAVIFFENDINKNKQFIHVFYFNSPQSPESGYSPFDKLRGHPFTCREMGAEHQRGDWGELIFQTK